MGHLIRWSCLLIVLVCSGTRGDDDQYGTAGRHLLAIYSNPDVNRATKERNLREMAQFYDAYQDQIGLTSEERLRAEELRKRYTEAIQTGVLAEGETSREGTIGPIVAKYIVEGVVDLAKVVESHRSSSAKGIEINRIITIIGFIFCLFSSGMFRSKYF
ncbi:protein Turandot X-like [Drosophila persimilis]|uniref:protein Turandot X-like n=1 Tax=Drosophila persimilis TaxID=7234 RepID=UPI00070869A6|nr:protein Turandot X-like [Drosophila persimilis]